MTWDSLSPLDVKSSHTIKMVTFVGLLLNRKREVCLCQHKKFLFRWLDGERSSSYKSSCLDAGSSFCLMFVYFWWCWRWRNFLLQGRNRWSWDARKTKVRKGKLLNQTGCQRWVVVWRSSVSEYTLVISPRIVVTEKKKLTRLSSRRHRRNIIWRLVFLWLIGRTILSLPLFQSALLLQLMTTSLSLSKERIRLDPPSLKCRCHVGCLCERGLQVEE